MRGKLQSIRTRLTVWYAGSLLVLLLLLLAGIFITVRMLVVQHAGQAARRDLSFIQGAFKEMALYAHDNADQQNSHLSQIQAKLDHANALIFAITSSTGLHFQSQEWKHNGLGPLLYVKAEADIRLVKINKKHFGILHADGMMSGHPYTLYVAHDTEALFNNLAHLWRIFLISIPFALVLAVGVGYFMAGRVLAPLGKIAASAQRISATRLTERLPVEDAGDEFGRLATVFNQMLDRLEGAFSQLTRFTSHASHELRTPLSALRSTGEMALTRELDTHGYRETIGSMLEEIARLSSITDNLLLLTRGEYEGSAYLREKIELAAICREVTDCLGILAEEKRQSLTLSAPPDIVVLGNRLLLQRAVVNLIDNAIKFSPEGGSIDVRVFTLRSEAVIEVRDTGVGIPAEFQSRIFDRFYRIDTAQQHSPTGSGLGLAIVKFVAEVHGGNILLESEVKKGSTFRLVLPLV